jgi:hypothetical protein
MDLAVNDVGKIIDFHTAARAQLKVIEKTSFKKVVRLQRQDWIKVVRYYVGLRLIPDVPDGVRVLDIEELSFRVFGGRERKQAIEYADQLVKEHDAVLEKIGF